MSGVNEAPTIDGEIAGWRAIEREARRLLEDIRAERRINRAEYLAFCARCGVTPAPWSQHEI